MSTLQHKLNSARNHLIRGDYSKFQDVIEIVEKSIKITRIQQLESLILKMLFIDKTDFFGSRDEIVNKTTKLLDEICSSSKSEIIKIMDSNSNIPASLAISTIDLLTKQTEISKHNFILIIIAKIKFQYKYNIKFSLYSHYLETILRIIEDMNEDYFYSELLNELCWSFTYRVLVDKALETAKVLLQRAKKLASQDLIMRAVAYLRYNYSEKGFHSLSLDYGYKYLELAKISKSTFRLWHAHLALSSAFCYSGDLINSSKYLELAISYEKELTHKNYAAWGMLIRSQISYYEGNLSKALEQQNKVLKTFQDSKHLLPVGFAYGMMGSISSLLGDYNDAIEFYQRSLDFRERYESDLHIAMTYFNLLCIYAVQRDNKKLKECLSELYKIDKTSSNNSINAIIEAGKAIYLRYESDQIKQAKEVFKEIIMDKSIFFATTEKSYLYICDILLEELKNGKDINILEELKKYVTDFTDFAEKNQSYLLLIELYFLKSKLHTLEFQIDESLSILERAQEVAHQKGLNRLEIHLSNEYDALLSQLDIWDEFSNYLPTLEERFEASHIEDILSKMLSVRGNYKEVSIEEEKPVFFLILDRENSIIFADSFSTRSIEEIQFAELFAKISEKRSSTEQNNKILRVVYREFMCVLSKKQDLLLCYVFIGKSFLAKQKFSQLISSFSNSGVINSFNEIILQKKSLNLDFRTQISSIIRKAICP